MRYLAKYFSVMVVFAFMALPLGGCGGVESEPIGVPANDQNPLEGVDLSQES